MDPRLKLWLDLTLTQPGLKLRIHAERGVYKFRFFHGDHGETSVIGQTGITRPLVFIFVKHNFTI